MAKARVRRCPFCDINPDRIVRQNEMCYAVHDKYPVTPLHSLIIPKRHIGSYFELYQPEINGIQSLLHEFKDDIEKQDRNEGDVVLDPFCGCATTIATAQKTGRKWIGIDISLDAINLFSKLRLQDKKTFGLIEGVDYVVDGIPRNIEGARALWERDPFRFQDWAVRAVVGTPSKRKSGDGGIDGNIAFDDHRNSKKRLRMVLQVKGGETGVSPNDNRALIHAMRRESEENKEVKAVMAGIITMDDLSQRRKSNYIGELGNDTVYTHGDHRYQRLQFLSVNDILNGEIFNVPEVRDRRAEQQSLWEKMFGVS